MKGYKAYKKGLKCRDFQYIEGEIYEEKEAVICDRGFHFCENPLDVLNYYNLCDCEFTEVEALGDIKSHDNPNADSKRCTNKIKIGVKLDLSAFIKASVEFLFEKTKCQKDEEIQAASGYFSQLAASGDSSQLAASGDSSKLAASGYSSKLAASGDSSQLAASGDSSKLAASGYFSQLAASGDSSQLAASGDSSKLAASGDSSQLEINGKFSVGAGIGINNMIKGVLGSWITLAEWEWAGSRYIPVCVKSAQIDGEILKAETWYRLENGEFKEG